MLSRERTDTATPPARPARIKRAGALPRRAYIALALAAALAAAGLTQAPAQAHTKAGTTTQSCGWLFRVSGDQANVAFPDSAANYWASSLPIPPGYHIEIHGLFPYARYMSFMTYSPATQGIDGIPDERIVPDPGSSNPFVTGARRNVKKRAYTVKVVNAVEPSAGGKLTPAPNTIYTERPGDPTKTSRPTDTATFILRVYEPNRGRDITGGVGLPAIAEVADDGSARHQVPDCPDHSLPSTQALTDQLAASGSGAGNDSIPSVELGGQNPPVWQRYTNLVNGVDAGVFSNPRTGAVYQNTQGATNMLPSGGSFDNLDNAYMTTYDTSSYGDIAVFHGKAPTTPPTFDAEPIMQPAQLRYWSMCSNAATTQYFGCVKDDDVPLDSNGYYTIVTSTAANRPTTATSACGIAWLPKGPLPSAVIILRNMLPDPSFTQAIQDVAAQGQEQQTLGPYYPQGAYFDHAANFDTFVNANGGCGGFQWPAASVKTYTPAGLPLLG